MNEVIKEIMYNFNSNSKAEFNYFILFYLIYLPTYLPICEQATIAFITNSTQGLTQCESDILKCIFFHLFYIIVVTCCGSVHFMNDLIMSVETILDLNESQSPFKNLLADLTLACKFLKEKTNGVVNTSVILYLYFQTLCSGSIILAWMKKLSSYPIFEVTYKSCLCEHVNMLNGSTKLIHCL